MRYPYDGSIMKFMTEAINVLCVNIKGTRIIYTILVKEGRWQMAVLLVLKKVQTLEKHYDLFEKK